MISACTIVAANYAAFARVLADSLFAHHPDASFTVLLIDDEERRMPLPDARIDWRRLGDIGLDAAEIHRLAGIYDVTELSTAVKPVLLQRLLDEGRSEVLYLDPDIRVFDSLEHIAALARDHDIVLTPHTMKPMPKDGLEVDDRYILAAGVYNLGFIAVGQNARPFLDWWWQSTRREALIDVTRMMFTDQRWVDFVPSLFTHHLLKDPGCNVAYWNLHGRNVTREGDRYFVDGMPLRFFHFSGFDSRAPGLLSRHQGQNPRVRLDDRPALADLCRDYAARLESAAIGAATTQPYGWSRTTAGFDLDRRTRRVYWSALRAAERDGGTEPPDPFDPIHPHRFAAWLNAPETDGPPRVSRYLHALYRDRLDLQIAFPDLHGADADRFADWVWRDGVAQERVIVELLPPREGDVHASVAPAPVSTSAESGLELPGASAAAPSVVASASAAVEALQAMMPHLQQFATPRPSVDGRRLPAVRGAFQRGLFRAMRPYWFQQRQFNDAMVGALHTSVGVLAGEIAKLSAAVDASHRDTDARLEQVESARTRVEASISGLSLQRVAESLQSDRSRLVERSASGAARLGYGGAVSESNGHGHNGDLSAETISMIRQRVYLPLLRNRARVVDVDCGRGGMLDLLRIAGVPATGVELDDAMVAHCRANGHTVEHVDAIEFLRAQADGSIGAIFTRRLTQLLPFERLQEFLHLCRSRVETGGLLIAETANPQQAAEIGTRVTHVARPDAIDPEVALALCRMAGFEQAHVLFPTGTGDLDVDRFAAPTYAVVATRAQGSHSAL